MLTGDLVEFLLNYLPFCQPELLAETLKRAIRADHHFNIELLLRSLHFVLLRLPPSSTLSTRIIALCRIIYGEHHPDVARMTAEMHLVHGNHRLARQVLLDDMPPQLLDAHLLLLSEWLKEEENTTTGFKLDALPYLK